MSIGRPVGQSLVEVVRASARRPGRTVALATLLAIAGAAYTWHSLGFVASPLKLLPQHARYVVLFPDYLRDFGELNDILVVVAAPDPEMAKAYATRLGDALPRAGLGSRVTFRIDPGPFERRGLLYLSPADLVALRDRLFDSEELLRAYATHPTLTRLVDGFNRQLANAMALGFLDLGLGRARGGDLRFLETLVDQVAARIDGRMDHESSWSAALSLGGLADRDRGWFFSSDRRRLFVFIEPRRVEGDFTDNRERIALIRATIKRLSADFPGVAAGVTGGPAIGSDEMTTALADGSRATALAFVLTLGLVCVGFWRVAKPLLMLATLAVGLAWAMGIITLVVGHLSVFSVMFVSIVVGLGIDYGIYFLFRYEEELALGASLDRALRRTAALTGPGILLGALTAAGTFFVLLLTGFQGIREFGAVSGIAILTSFLSMITLFPALLVLVDRGRASAPMGSPTSDPGPPAAHWLERLTGRRRTILAASVVVSGLAAWGRSDSCASSICRSIWLTSGRSRSLWERPWSTG
jgi:uncharacterized protein